MKIANFKIGAGHPVFIIAELSANHLQQYEIAVRTIKAAKAAGADAIKLQTYTPDTITIDCPNKYFQINSGTLWDGRTLYDLYKEAYTPWEWQPKLKQVAESLGLICFSSPFDKLAVDFLEKMKVPAYKIASFEITDIPLIKYVASRGKPVLISTGVATPGDIKEALKACHKEGNHQIALLKCTSSYPAPVSEANLLTIPDMEKRFKTVVGLSDHTMGASVAIASVALGAKIIEKHLVIDRSLGGADSAFSMEPGEFRDMVNGVREAEKSLGSVTYNLSEAGKKSRRFSRSLFVVEDMKKGEVFSEKNVRSIRPAFGLAPKYINALMGKKAKKNIKKGTPLSWSLVA